MSISTSNTQRTTQTMNLNQNSSINSNISTWVFLHSSLLSFSCSFRIILQCTMRVSISVFPPTPKLSNLELKSYLPALTILNVVYLLRTRAIRSRSIYNIQVRFILNDSFKIAQQLPRQFQNLCWLIQLFSASALARLMSRRCSCIM
jgi:hypothetical protein